MPAIILEEVRRFLPTSVSDTTRATCRQNKKSSLRGANARSHQKSLDRIQLRRQVVAEEWQPSYQALLDAIPESLASDHKAALKTRLQYGFEISVSKRQMFALKGLEERTRILITDGDERFVERCVETRNGLTHEGSGSLVTEGLEVLWKVNRRLRALVTCLIWKELGLSEERIVTEVFSRVRP